MKKRYTRQLILESILYWENVILESKLTDLITLNNWTKKDALKPENFKQLKKAWKQGDDVMKSVVNRIFGKDGKFVGEEEAKKQLKDLRSKKAAKKSEGSSTSTSGKDTKKKTTKPTTTGTKSKSSPKKPTELQTTSADSSKKPTELQTTSASTGSKSTEEEKENKPTTDKDTNGNQQEAPTKPDAKDESAAKELINKEEKTEVPVGDFNLYNRMYRIHNGAVKKVRESLGGMLLKQKAGSPETVNVFNSCITDNTFQMPDDGKMYITITVKLDKAQLTGFKKMVALMKEDEFYESMNEEELNEGFWGDFVNGLKKMKADMGNTAKEKLQTAHTKLKKNIGIEATRTYVTAFCGKKLGDLVSLKNVSLNEDEDGTEGAEISFKCLINIK